MFPFQSRNLAALVVLASVCLGLRSDAARAGRAAMPPARMATLPKESLWVWERPEDLRSVNPSTTAIAYLDQTVLVGAKVASKRRMQPLAFPTEAARIAVVRVEVQPGAELEERTRRQAAELVLQSAWRPGIAALQVDFDATRSQRKFYRELLVDVRRGMPATLPLSMTALASWCSYDDWIAGLPVDEAVPMFFRMEPDRRQSVWQSVEGLNQFEVREPLCQSSAGVSTHEAWPRDTAGKRLYIFADRGWSEDLPLLERRLLP